MNNRPIGVFDSGVGGLTAVKEIRKNLPSEDIIYFGDTGRVPYGNRSQETIKKYATQIIKYLTSYNVKGILAACGTVSTNFSAEDYEKLNTDVPYFTIVEPSVHRAVDVTRNGKISVMATSASIRSGKFQREINRLNPDIQVTAEGCPLLVNLVESGITDPEHPVLRAVLEMYLEEIIASESDTVILGCTHFPIIKKAIGIFLGEKVALIDSGAEAAKALQSQLDNTEALSQEKEGTLKCYITDTKESFINIAKNFLEEDILTDVEKVEIELIDV